MGNGNKSITHFLNILSLSYSNKIVISIAMTNEHTLFPNLTEMHTEFEILEFE